MAQGRCPGCGETGSARAVTSHMAGCARYAQLFAAGGELRSPEEEFRAFAAERSAEPVVAKPRAPRPKVSDRPATVSAPKQSARRSEPAGGSERVAGPVNVEYWQIPHTL